jgi:plasmid stability protein
LPPEVVGRLKERARRNHRSLQAELRAILEEAARAEARDFRKIAARIRRELSGRLHGDSAELVAEDRAR